MTVPSLVVIVLSRFSSLGLEEVEALACLAVAAIVTADRLAAAAMPPLPIRNLRRDVNVSVVNFVPVIIFKSPYTWFNLVGIPSPDAHADRLLPFPIPTSLDTGKPTRR